MRVLHLSTSDISGGAAISAFRLHHFLRQAGCSSQMLVQDKQSIDPTVLGPVSNPAKALAHLRTSVDHFPKFLFSNRKTPFFHLQWLPERIPRLVNRIKPDVVHVHWICRGFVSINTFARLKVPVIWTLHDLWPMTGGCHYPNDCMLYTSNCGKCPQLGSRFEKDLSRWVWRRKARSWKDMKFTLIAPSQWIKDKTRKSSLFFGKSVRVIPNGVDLSRFCPTESNHARRILNLPENDILILFGAISAAIDLRKGFHLLRQTIETLPNKISGRKLTLVVFGADSPSRTPEEGADIQYLGNLRDEISVDLAYNACDVFVCPSLEDNLPNTLIEAMASGTPCVAFNIGGIPEIIDHMKTGYLAQKESASDLAKGIQWILENKSRRQQLSSEARRKAEREYDGQIIAKKMINLYEEVLSNRQIKNDMHSL